MAPRLGDALPLGVFNRGRILFAGLSYGLLLPIGVAVALLVADLLRRRRSWLGGLVVRFVVLGIVVELAVTSVDVGLVSRSPTALLGGPYWEVQVEGGPWVPLKKASRGFGFRASEPYAPEPGVQRVLFLGDSYTEGSASTLSCNYPQVVERALRERLDQPVEVMNAGVAGYGPVEAAKLLELLVARGYSFDAVVFNLFFENDFTDDLPGTARRVVAGMLFRFPRNPLLRWPHPLHSRSFRYAVFFGTAARIAREEGDLVRREPVAAGDCRARATPLGEVQPYLRALVRRRLASNYGPGGGRTAEGVVTGALERMRAVAKRLEVPFAVVSFPDRILVDPELRRKLPLDESRWNLDRLKGWAEDALPSRSETWIDVAPALRGKRGLYRPVDTHLSDAGNKIAGEHVADGLAPLLADAIGRRSRARSP